MQARSLPTLCSHSRHGRSTEADRAIDTVALCTPLLAEVGANTLAASNHEIASPKSYRRTKAASLKVTAGESSLRAQLLLSSREKSGGTNTNKVKQETTEGAIKWIMTECL